MLRETSKFPVESFDDSWEINPKDQKPQSGKQVREFLSQQFNTNVSILRFNEISKNLYGFASEKDAEEYDRTGNADKAISVVNISSTNRLVVLDSANLSDIKTHGVYYVKSLFDDSSNVQVGAAYVDVLKANSEFFIQRVYPIDKLDFVRKVVQ